MKDIELQPFPWGRDFPAWLEVRSDEEIQAEFAAYARAAIEADRAQRVPERKPMFWVRLCSDGMYEGPIHDKQLEEVRRNSGAWSPLYLASTPAPAQQEPDWKAMYEHERRRSATWISKYEKDIGPIECAAPDQHQEQPQQERKPMTREQVRELMETVGYEAATPQEKADFINGIRHAERHHGIKE